MKGPQAYRAIPGWLTDNEAHALYNVARKTHGGLLEVGTFLGRSTSVLCEGIRDAGQIGRKFISYDLSCSSPNEFQAYAQTLGQDTLETPPLLTELWAKGTNSTDEAQKYLAANALLEYVKLRRGDFKQDTGCYDTMFVDVMHESGEVETNLPHIHRLAAPMALIAIHDMYVESTLQEVLTQARGKLHFFRLIDTLGLFQRL